MFTSLPNIHPFLVHFPIGIYTFAVLVDLALLARFRSPSLDRMVLVAYGAAFAGSLAAAVSGKLSADLLAPALDEETVAAVGSHGDWAFFTVVLLFLVLLLRIEASFQDRGGAPKLHRRRLAAILLALLAQWSLFTTAGLGGDLVFRHGVGVRGATMRE